MGVLVTATSRWSASARLVHPMAHTICLTLQRYPGQIAYHVDPARRNPLTVVFRSTFRPGTIEQLVYPIFQGVLGDNMSAVELIYNPEFLRESTAIKDYFNPPKIVVGTKDSKRSVNMDRLYENVSEPMFYTGYREAEFTKFVDNTFHALKVSFANEIGRVCSKLGIDVHKVHEIFISDTKLNISPQYLRPGWRFRRLMSAKGRTCTKFYLRRNWCQYICYRVAFAIE